MVVVAVVEVMEGMGVLIMVSGGIMKEVNGL